MTKLTRRLLGRHKLLETISQQVGGRAKAHSGPVRDPVLGYYVRTDWLNVPLVNKNLCSYGRAKFASHSNYQTLGAPPAEQLSEKPLEEWYLEEHPILPII